MAIVNSNTVMINISSSFNLEIRFCIDWHLVVDVKRYHSATYWNKPWFRNFYSQSECYLWVKLHTFVECEHLDLTPTSKYGVFIIENRENSIPSLDYLFPLILHFFMIQWIELAVGC
jgi:hypothetical protein